MNMLNCCKRMMCRLCPNNANHNNIQNCMNNITWTDTIPFVLPITHGRVIKCYDGDTITIAFKLPPYEPIYRISVRLNGIDCPEMKSKNADERKCAELAKARISDLILNKDITLKNISNEKYGRLLADVYIDDVHVNHLMISERLAVSYDGGTKRAPENWMEYHLKEPK